MVEPLQDVFVVRLGRALPTLLVALGSLFAAAAISGAAIVVYTGGQLVYSVGMTGCMVVISVALAMRGVQAFRALRVSPLSVSPDGIRLQGNNGPWLAWRDVVSYREYAESPFGWGTVSLLARDGTVLTVYSCMTGYSMLRRSVRSRCRP